MSAPKVARPTPWAAPALLLTWLLGSVVAQWVAGDLGYGRGAAAYLLGVVVLAALALELGLDHYVTLAFWGVLLAGAAAAPLVGEEVVDLLGRPLTLVLLALGLGAWVWRALPQVWPVTTVRREVGWWVGPGLALLLVSSLGVGGAAVAAVGPVVLLGLWLLCVAVLWTTGVDRPR